MKKDEIVKRILLMEIEGGFVPKRNGNNSFREKTGIQCNQFNTPRFALNIDKNKIISQKSYYYTNYEDVDMSDFAIGFYEIIYEDLLNNQSILDQSKIKNKSFMGDTMNSFNTVASLFKKIKGYKKGKCDYKEYPEWLQKYSAKYHCLANFWLLPMQLGRTITSTESILGFDLNKVTSSKDYMDQYLKNLEKQFPQLKKANLPYFSQFSNYDDFIEKHFLPEYTIFSKDNDPETIVSNMENFINTRAELIAKSDKVDKLYEYFDKNMIIN